MSGLQQLAAEQLNIALLADDLRSPKSQTFTHPQEVLDDRELALSTCLLGVGRACHREFAVASSIVERRYCSC
jgi:hypothetical protein